YAGHIVAKCIFVPAINFHPAPMRLGQNLPENVEAAVVGRFGLFERGVFVELLVRRGEIAAMKIQIVFLLAVVGQRMILDLAAADAASISEGRQEDGIYRAALLENVKHLFRAFVHEGNCAGLDADEGGTRDEGRVRGSGAEW